MFYPNIRIVVISKTRDALITVFGNQYSIINNDLMNWQTTKVTGLVID